MGLFASGQRIDDRSPQDFRRLTPACQIRSELLHGMKEPISLSGHSSSDESGDGAAVGAATSLRVAIIVFCFLVSVLIRAPNLNRPLSDHHEWVTAQTLIALQNLRTQGALKHKLVPIQTYPLPADKFVFNLEMNAFDGDGNGYYTSFPPFSVIAPYLLFTALSLDFTVLNLQLFNLAGHLIATLFLYFTLCRVLSAASSARTASTVGAVTFVFLAPNLWFYSNVYSWDTFWHYLWVVGIFYVIRIRDTIQHSSLTVGSLTVLGLIVFFVTYSEYQGLIFAVSVAVWGLGKKRQSFCYAKVAMVAAGAALLALCLTAYQYSSQVGLEVLVQSMIHTARFRSYFGGFRWLDIPAHYAVGVGYTLLPIAVMTAVSLRWGRRGWTRGIHEGESLFLYLSLVPVVSHHLLLPQWTAEHDYSIVKSMVFLAALIAWLFQKVATSRSTPRFRRIAVSLGLTYGLIASVYTYEREFARSSDPERYRDLGREIAAVALDSEVVFAVSSELIVPQLVYSSGRNIQTVTSEAQAAQWLKRHGREKGRVFYFDSAYKVLRSKPVDLDLFATDADLLPRTNIAKCWHRASPDR